MQQGYGQGQGQGYGQAGPHAANFASQHKSEDASFFSNAMTMMSGQQGGSFDQQSVQAAHQQTYNGENVSSQGAGQAAALQALKKFSGGSSGGGGSPNEFMGIAMAEAAKLFDGGNVQGDKQSTVNSALQTAMGMYTHSQGGRGGGGGSSLLSLASRFM